MRAVLAEWPDPPFDALCAFVADQGRFAIRAVDDRGWREFEVVDDEGATMLVGDLWTGSDAREELDELEEFLEDLQGPDASREVIEAHLQRAAAVVGLQILMSVYDESLACANVVVHFLEQLGGVLTQVDGVGWYDGARLVLSEAD